MLAWLACAVPRDTDADRALTGTVSDATGAPVVDGVVQACADVCVPSVTDADGAWAFRLPAGDWSVHATGRGEDDAQLVVPVALAGDVAVDLVVPDLGPPIAVPEDPTWVEVAPGLSLSLSADLGVDEVRVAALPAGDWPDADGLDGPPGSGWSLWPAGAGEGTPFRADAATRCTADDGASWVACEDALPDFGTIVVVP